MRIKIRNGSGNLLFKPKKKNEQCEQKIACFVALAMFFFLRLILLVPLLSLSFLSVFFSIVAVVVALSARICGWGQSRLSVLLAGYHFTLFRLCTHTLMMMMMMYEFFLAFFLFACCCRFRLFLCVYICCGGVRVVF